MMCFVQKLSMGLGGNQRELARQKNQKKQQETKGKKADDKDGNKGTTLQDRRQRYIVFVGVGCD